MPKTAKILSSLLCISTPLLAYAGQGIFIRLESSNNSAELRVRQSECIQNSDQIISANQTAYIESSLSGVCFFKGNKISYDLFINNGQQLQRYDIHLSVNGSDLTPNTIVTKNGYQITAQLFPHSGKSSSQDSILIHVQTTADSWQKDAANRIADLPVNQVLIPGSHDSGTYAISSSSFVAADAASEFLDFVSDIGLRSYIAGWAKTQNFTIFEQLTLGIRYLDLRACGRRLNGDATDAKSNIYICHTLSSVTLKKVIDEIAAFLNMPEHEKELLFIDINHLYSVDEQQLLSITDYIEQKLGSKIASPQEFTPQSSYNEFWAKHKQVVLFISDNQASTVFNQIYWPMDTIASPWPHTKNVNALIEHMETKLDNRDFTQFFVLQSQLTPDTNKYLAGLNPFTTSTQNLLQMTGEYQLTISNWFFQNKNALKKNGNIFIQDFIGGSL